MAAENGSLDAAVEQEPQKMSDAEVTRGMRNFLYKKGRELNLICSRKFCDPPKDYSL